ncbi:oligosaccharyltransferase alpha subunit [Lasallia pustulata]|uniref:Dolichyl-diphosphooligosaccharide--protein glycosyltransferase subunit 1 n=1 Tax=Lasallia pustulata TaxID=136370 RepID=A0A1W5CYU0_9LECA|nr:oligosaccharyltransferase alpha subunit [Lasallia pustulata]
MKPISLLTACLSLLTSADTAESNLSTPLSSRQILPSNFKPPQDFKNVNLVRTVNLEKGYAKENINVLIENTASSPQEEYYIPFRGDLIGSVGGLEVRDKKNPQTPVFESEVVEYDTHSPTQFYRITLPTPLAPSAQQTLSINYHLLSSLKPLPAAINQQDKQYLVYTFSTYCPSAYLTQKQKTKIKFQTTDIPDFTGEPERQGSTFTYGPYENIPAGAEQEASVRYEFTKPLTHATLLERDIEVSHWGGNLATEERYWLTNKGAHLANHFSRVLYAASNQYNPQYSPPTSALKALNVPLKAGSLNPYFTDDIGNVSTSRFRSNLREANLELMPRYPIFGGWNYNFRIGWDANLRDVLRKLKVGDAYVLKVPFLEGPKMSEGVSYGKVELKVILPEGATNVKFETSVPIVAVETSTHRTFMDTLGRTTLKLTAMNLVDESRNSDLFVTYDYPLIAGFRKPVTVFLGVISVFAAAWSISRLDVSIGKPS